MNTSPYLRCTHGTNRCRKRSSPALCSNAGQPGPGGRPVTSTGAGLRPRKGRIRANRCWLSLAISSTAAPPCLAGVRRTSTPCAHRRSRRSVEQPAAVRHRGGLGAAGGTQLGEDVGDVDRHGLGADEQPPADLTVAARPRPPGRGSPAPAAVSGWSAAAAARGRGPTRARRSSASSGAAPSASAAARARSATSRAASVSPPARRMPGQHRPDLGRAMHVAEVLEEGDRLRARPGPARRTAARPRPRASAAAAARRPAAAPRPGPPAPREPAAANRSWTASARRRTAPRRASSSATRCSRAAPSQQRASASIAQAASRTRAPNHRCQMRPTTATTSSYAASTPSARPCRASTCDPQLGVVDRDQPLLLPQLAQPGRSGLTPRGAGSPPAAPAAARAAIGGPG